MRQFQNFDMVVNNPRDQMNNFHNLLIIKPNSPQYCLSNSTQDTHIHKKRVSYSLVKQEFCYYKLLVFISNIPLLILEFNLLKTVEYKNQFNLPKPFCIFYFNVFFFFKWYLIYEQLHVNDTLFKKKKLNATYLGLLLLFFFFLGKALFVYLCFIELFVYICKCWVGSFVT